MLNCVIVGLGGFIGAVLRYLISLIPIKNPDSFPINTFIINILGALIIGIIAFTAAKNQNLDAKSDRANPRSAQKQRKRASPRSALARRSRVIRQSAS